MRHVARTSSLAVTASASSCDGCAMGTTTVGMTAMRSNALHPPASRRHISHVGMDTASRRGGAVMALKTAPMEAMKW